MVSQTALAFRSILIFATVLSCLADGAMDTIKSDVQSIFGGKLLEGFGFSELMKYSVIFLAIIIVASCILGVILGVLWKKGFRMFEDPLWSSGKSNQALPNSYQVVSRRPVVVKTT
ncbi:hypothetical protein AAMO2058_000195500 [Amorphochlora amoebiformis]|eukprot:803396-Amorphochlora_amoeboformis.AAC.1